MAGYSGTPLIKKLGIKEGFRVAFLGAPAGLAGDLGPLPANVRVLERPRLPMDFVLLFTKSAASLERHFGKTSETLAATGMLWVSWPKKVSSVVTDLSENIVRHIGLSAGLVDVKVCAVNDVWSGLKFVYRLQDRTRLRH
ncbi:MAG: hypothetical protein JWM21_4667 [Acidobacteria bacterium]|nr:hypothetical protein [Acidobacteriota bacterium]